MNTSFGAVASGHQATADAACEILQDGGNAFDAVVAAHFMACVAEPVLASLGGGGFLLAHTHKTEVIYDFFAHTPRKPLPREQLEFFPIEADFGYAQQTFHIGMGAVATPGTVRGLFEIHRDLCTLPMHRLMEPAIRAARAGIELNEFQDYIFNLVEPILQATTDSRKQFNSQNTHQLISQSERLKLPALADTLEILASQGDTYFYEGDLARQIVELSSTSGGQITLEDLKHYQVYKRPVLSIDYKQATLSTNPPPSCGGTLIAFALKLLEKTTWDIDEWGSTEYMLKLAQVMELTNRGRLKNEQDKSPLMDILDPGFLSLYRQQVETNPWSTKGTTHICVMDKLNNIASLTVSNGEGCGHLIPDSGIMLNNMLGEEDLNPQGFEHWPANRRLTSMMAPSLLSLPGNRYIALGSGGSNRIRTAILQVLVNIVDFDFPISQAVARPRIHHEDGQLNIEKGFSAQHIDSTRKYFSDAKIWDSRNLFFGGVHCVFNDGTTMHGTGDPRRGGVAIVI